VRLHGGVPSAQRGELVERFRTDPDVQVFVSTDATGTGPRAALVTRALALQQAAQVPNSLAEALLADAHGFLTRA
jgi:superfamily II DNA/RNA helicase